MKAFVTNLFWGLLLVAQIIHWLAHKRTNYAPEQYFFRRFISWSAKLGVLLLFCLVAGYSVQHSLRFSEIAGGIALCLAGGLGIAGYMYASDQPAKTIQALDLDQGKDKAV